MFAEDTTVIESLLDQGADIKTSEAEGEGILHAILDNLNWNDQEKEALVETFFRKADSVDDINTNRIKATRKFLTPWSRALNKNHPRTAHMIIDNMSFRQVNESGLYSAVQNNEHNDIIRNLLGKYREPSHPHLVRRMLRQVFAHTDIGQGCFDPENQIDIIESYYLTEQHFHTRHDKFPNFIQGHHLWKHAWVDNDNLEVAISIITGFMPQVHPPINHEEMTTYANQVVANFRELNRNWSNSLEIIDAEWNRIKQAFISIGVPANLLHD
jgi:hypothetical protein